MTTLADIALEVAKMLTDVVEGVCDSGSTTTLVDSERKEKNGTFNGGTLFVLSGDNAGEVLVVSGFAGNTITVDTQSSAFASGDRYALCNADFPYWKIRQSINTVLGDVLSVDESLSFTASDYIYTLPTLSGRVVGVAFVDDIGESTERAVVSAHWRVRRGELVFDDGFGGSDGDTIRLQIKGPHDDLIDADDILDAGLNKERVKWDAIVNALQWGFRKYKNQPDKQIEEFLQMALAKQEQFGRLQNVDFPVVRFRSAGWR